MKNKNEKGITLIALVITIIVLLILAGVAINMAIDSNGLFGKANEAATGWNTAVENESTATQGLLDKLEIDPPGVVSAQGVTLDKTSVSVMIGKTAQLTATVTPNDATNTNVTWSSSDEAKVTVDENGVVTGISEGTATITVTTESKNKTATCSVTVTNPVSAWVEEGTRKAPIPVGYVASQISTEDTISEGLVIYQGTEPVTGVANSTEHTTAMTTRNQFVWIPVDDINYMVMCKNNNKLADANGNKTCDLELVDGVLQCVNSAHTSTATDLCGRRYGFGQEYYIVGGYASGYEVYTCTQNFTDPYRSGHEWNIWGREPDIVGDFDKDDTESTTYMAIAGIASGKVADFESQLKSDFTAMATSVAKYGGFYVSRYESGANGSSLKNQKVMVAGTSTTTGYDKDTVVSGNMWYGMYNTLRSSIAIDKTAVSTHMIWGSQSSMIVKFLEENGINESQIAHRTRQLETQELTGETTTDIMSNIYDFEGNNEEFTAMAYGSNSRNYCGGSFREINELRRFRPASYRGSAWPSSANYSYIASRCTLYL